MKKIFFTLAIFAFVNFSAKAQTYFISTIAGDSIQGYSGDGGAATSAELYYPTGVAIDGTGNLYIADFSNNCIRKVNTTGIISTIAGNGIGGYNGDGGLAIDAELASPEGVAVDAVGDVYIADTGNNRIRKVNTTGIISTIAGNGIGGYNGDGGVATSTELGYPEGVLVDATGNVYISEAANNLIREINTSGIITIIAGRLIPGYSGDGGLATGAELNTPIGISEDETGNIYIADRDNKRIRKINTSGIISTIAGDSIQGYSGDGGLAKDAELNSPSGVVVDVVGNVYIADYGNNRIRKINSAGIISTIVGDTIQGYSGDGGLATDAELASPYGLTLDAAGNIYIADTYNNRIRKLTVATGIPENNFSNDKVHIFPNPNDGKMTFTYTLNPNDKGKLDLYDFTGRHLKTYILNAASNTMEINESQLSNGIYFYRVAVNDAMVKADKIVIIH